MPFSESICNGFFLYFLRYRFLRSSDRETNKDDYPRLHYPELYLMGGGYKEFYCSYKVIVVLVFMTTITLPFVSSVTYLL